MCFMSEMLSLEWVNKIKEGLCRNTLGCLCHSFAFRSCMNVNLSETITYILNQVYTHKGTISLYLQKNNKRESVANYSPSFCLQILRSIPAKYNFFGTMCSFSHRYLFVVSTFYQLKSEKKQDRNVNLANFRQTLPLKVYFLFLHTQAIHQREWNITAVSVSSTEVHVGWFRMNTCNSNSSYIYGYVAALQILRIGTGEILVLNVTNTPASNVNTSSFGTLVSGLRPYTKYGVKVVALVRDRMTGVISLKSSSVNEVQTLEDGE